MKRDEITYTVYLVICILLYVIVSTLEYMDEREADCRAQSMVYDFSKNRCSK